MGKLALRSIVKIHPGGSPRGCSVCKREICPGEQYTTEVCRWTATEERDEGTLYCCDCREIPGSDDFSDLTDSEVGKAAARTVIENLPRRRKEVK